MADFEKSYNRTLKFEGGYADSPYDKGGKTRYGITENVARLNGYTGDMKELPLELAKKIYYEQYWNRLKLDIIDNQAVADELFDTGVNCGIYTAARMFQEALNLLNRNQRKWNDIIVDGVIGQITLSIYSKLSESEKRSLVKTLNGLQFMRYVEIVKNDPEQEMNFIGWLLRVSV